MIKTTSQLIDDKLAEINEAINEIDSMSAEIRDIEEQMDFKIEDLRIIKGILFDLELAQGDK